MKKVLFVLFSFPVISSCETPATKSECGPLISDFELNYRLSLNPYFANGVPPPGKKMRVEHEACGFRIYVGIDSPDSFAGDLILVDRKGKILQIVTHP